MRAMRIALRLLLSALFFYAAFSKWGAPRAFAEDIANYRILPAALVPMATVGFLGLEVILAFALLLGIWPFATAILTTLVLGIFTVAVLSALVRGLQIECGCFGAGGSPATWMTFFRDLGLCAVAVVLMFSVRPRGSQAAEQSTQQQPVV